MKVETRCPWCGTDPLYVAYHDAEWGVPERNGRALFEKLVLDGFQAGLSWLTILRKRPAFQARFASFDPLVLAQWGEAEIAAALGDAGIVRHRGKIEATIGNAIAWEKIEAETGFSQYLWAFVDNAPIVNRYETQSEVPTQTPQSVAMAKSLKSHGFRFCGPVICYAFMEAVGMVNDHLTTCPRHEQVIGL